MNPAKNDESPQPRRATILRRVVRGAAVAVCALAVLVPLALYGALAAVNTGKVRRFALSRVNDLIPGSVQLAGLRLRLLDGEVDLTGTAVIDPDGDTIAGIGRLTLAVDLTALVHKTVVVRQLIIERPWANLCVDSSGVLNIVGAFVSPGKPATPASPPDTGQQPSSFGVIVRDLAIRDLRAAWLDANSGLTAMVAGLGVRARGDLGREHAQVQISIDTGAAESSAFEARLSSLVLSASLTGTTLDSLDLVLESPRSRLRISGRADSLFTAPRPSIDLQLAVALEELKEYLHLDAALSGRLDMAVNAAGTVANPAGTVRAHYGGGQVWGQRLDTLHLDLALEDRVATLSPLMADVGAGTATVRGWADIRGLFPRGFTGGFGDLDAMVYRLDVSGRSVDIAALTGSRSGPRGLAGLDATVEGTGIMPERLESRATVVASVRSLALSSGIAGVDAHARVTARVAGGVALAENIAAAVGAATLAGTASYGFRSGAVDATLSLDAPDLAATLPAFALDSISGAARLEAAVSGTVARPSVALTLAADSLDIKGTQLDMVQLRARLDTTGTAHIGRCTVRRVGSSLHMAGRCRVLERGRPIAPNRMDFAARLTADTLLLDDFVPGFGGTASLHADLAGTVAAPDGSVDARVDSLVVGDLSLHAVTLAARLDSATAHIAPLRVAITPTEALTVNGSVSLDKTYDLALAADSVSLAGLAAAAGIELPEGKLSLRLAGAGSFDSPRASGGLHLTGLQVNNTPVNEFALELSLKDHSAHVAGYAGFDLDGMYHLTSKEFSATARFDRTDLAPYFTIAGRQSLSGTLTGTVAASGNAAAPDSIVADLRITHLLVTHRDVEAPLVETRGLAARYNRQSIDVPRFTIAVLDKGSFVLEGTGDLDGAYRAAVKGDIPLRLASLLSADFPDLSGTAQLDASIIGRTGTPAIAGALRLNRASMVVPGLGQSLHDINGSISLTNEAVRIDSIAGYLDNGRLLVGGSLALDSLRPGRIDLKLNANALPLQMPGAEALIDADLTARGTLDSSWVEGQIVLLRGLYYQDVSLNPFGGIGKTTRAAGQTAPAQDSSILDNVKLDIALARRGTFEVDNNLAFLSIDPDLELRGTLANPVINGRATVRSGTVYYRRREFSVSRGIVDFVNPYRTEVLLDLEGQTVVGGDSRGQTPPQQSRTITLAVSGPLDGIKFALSSNPHEEDADILSLLIFGKTRAEMQESNVQTVLSPQELLSDFFANRISDDIKKRTGLDMLDVETGGPGGKLPLGFKVTVGKQISPRLTTKYTVESGKNDAVQRATAEYRLFENALISGFQDTEGTYGGEIQFTTEFR